MKRMYLVDTKIYHGSNVRLSIRKENTIKVQLVELFGVKLLKSYFDWIQFELLHFAQVTQMKWEEYLTRFCHMKPATINTFLNTGKENSSKLTSSKLILHLNIVDTIFKIKSELIFDYFYLTLVWLNYITILKTYLSSS